MIRLEAIQAAETVAAVPSLRYVIIPFYFVVHGDGKFIALSQNADFVLTMEKESDAVSLMAIHNNFKLAGNQIAVLSNRQFPEIESFMNAWL